MKISRGNIAHKVMTLLKMALRKLRGGAGVGAAAEAWMSLLTLGVTEDAFWGWFRRFVKYCGGRRDVCGHLSHCAHKYRPRTDMPSEICPSESSPPRLT